MTSLRFDEHGRLVMHIVHDVLKGVTPDMVAWWFGHIGGTMDVEGRELNRYLVWHPVDHIHWELAKPDAAGGAGTGAKFRIVEAFGRNPEFYIDVTETVVRLDPTGITLVGKLAGVAITSLRHDFSVADGGTRYVSTLTVGTCFPGLRTALNPLIHRRFTPAMGRAWLRHNVEEVGLLEHIIPALLGPR